MSAIRSKGAIKGANLGYPYSLYIPYSARYHWWSVSWYITLAFFEDDFFHFPNGTSTIGGILRWICVIFLGTPQANPRAHMMFHQNGTSISPFQFPLQNGRPCAPYKGVVLTKKKTFFGMGMCPSFCTKILGISLCKKSTFWYGKG